MGDIPRGESSISFECTIEDDKMLQYPSKPDKKLNIDKMLILETSRISDGFAITKKKSRRFNYSGPSQHLSKVLTTKKIDQCHLDINECN